MTKKSSARKSSRKTPARKSSKTSKSSKPPILPRLDEYQAEDDLRTLKRAEEIKADKKRLLNAKKALLKEEKALKDVKGKITK